MRHLLIAATLLLPLPAAAQIPPSQSELRVYAGLHAAAAKGDAAEIARLIAAGQNVNAQDAHSRTPLHVAAHFGHQAAAQALLNGGANPNALDAQKYDIVTIVGGDQRCADAEARARRRHRPEERSPARTTAPR